MIERNMARIKNKDGLMNSDPVLGSFLTGKETWLLLPAEVLHFFIGFNLLPKELCLKKWPHTQCTFLVAISKNNKGGTKGRGLLGLKV